MTGNPKLGTVGCNSDRPSGKNSVPRSARPSERAGWIQRPSLDRRKGNQRIRSKSSVSYRAHDFRRTAASIMAGMGVPRLVIGKILNHAETGVTRVYDRHSYDKEKKEALAAWGARLSRIVSDLELAMAKNQEA